MTLVVISTDSKILTLYLQSEFSAWKIFFLAVVVLK